MSEYTYAAEQMKESIIEDYLQKHPDIRRSEIVTKFVNGRVVVGTMTEILHNVAGRKSVQDASTGKNKKLLDELAKGGDVRYAECVKSIESSNTYLEWLSMSRYTGFTEDEYEENIVSLARLQPICNDRAVDLHESKMKFAEAMQTAAKPTRSLIQTLMAEYLQAFSGQVKAQRSIFKREVDLGDRFSTCTGNFIQDNFSGIRSNPNPAAVKAVAKAINILKNQNIDIGQIQNEKDIKKLNKALEFLGIRLNARREELANLQKLINFIDALVNEIMPAAQKADDASMGEEAAPDSGQPTASQDSTAAGYGPGPVKKTSPDGGPRHRMAYTSKKTGSRDSSRRR